jgi:hypothetical protein
MAPPEPLPAPLGPPAPDWPLLPSEPLLPGEPLVPGAPLELVPPLLIAPPDAGDPAVPVEPAGVPDEQAEPAIASTAPVARKKRRDVMRSSSFGILTAGICQGSTARARRDMLGRSRSNQQ